MLLAGCSALSVQPDYVKADRDTYNAIAPEYIAYVTSDKDLSQEDKDFKLDTIKLWDARLRKFGK
jgi:hypothetical protein